MSKYHVTIYPEIVSDTVQVERRDYTKKKYSKTGDALPPEECVEYTTRANMNMHIVNDDNPNEQIIVPWFMLATSSDTAQSYGSALTYANRYFHLKFFNIATPDDDPDSWRQKKMDAIEKENVDAAKAIIAISEIYEYISSLGSTMEEVLLQGEHLIHVIVREMNAAPSQSEIERDKALNDCRDIYYVVNPESSYACDRNGFSIEYGEMRQVLEGGDYSYIYTTQLAYERGKYENYLKTRLNTDVELTTVLVPFMDVNKKIQYTSPITGEVHQYIIKSIDFDILNYTMTMSLSRFYNYYPF